WARVETACGLEPAPAFVSAQTAWRTMTRRDPHVNILRATMAAFAAGLGGANAVTVLPFTAALGLPDGFARRLARNTQLVLLHESNLAKVSDPAAGSGAIENLTSDLCGAAWTFLQEIERAGGVWAALEQDLIQSRAADAREARERAVAHRKEVLTGTSDFPDINEAPVAVLDVGAVGTPPVGTPSVTFTPLPRRRLAEPFERLRDASDRALAATGSRPRIFLANLGPLAAFTARATFARNFFEAGGIEAVTNDGFARPDAAASDVRTDLAALAAAFAACGTAAACLCSSDEIYDREAAAAVRALTQAGARYVYLAGRPGERERMLRDSGVHAFIYRGCDALQVLAEAQRLLGLA
ncbi:MAG TPA: methylmalonyl-CoA mutase family protein, partial [Xanthobacteraceae bacterium]|nr:methylmalonyl-CoA mutase family protein [Xanthobacteraceae bacterium]